MKNISAACAHTPCLWVCACGHTVYNTPETFPSLPKTVMRPRAACDPSLPLVPCHRDRVVPSSALRETYTRTGKQGAAVQYRVERRAAVPYQPRRERCGHWLRLPHFRGARGAALAAPPREYSGASQCASSCALASGAAVKYRDDGVGSVQGATSPMRARHRHTSQVRTACTSRRELDETGHSAKASRSSTRRGARRASRGASASSVRERAMTSPSAGLLVGQRAPL